MAEGTVHEGKIRRVKRILYPLVKIIAYAGSSAEGYPTEIKIFFFLFLIDKSEVVEVPMSRKVRLCAIIAFIIALIISIIRILIDFNYGIERISPLIPVLDIASAIVWVICIVVNCVLYQKKDR